MIEGMIRDEPIREEPYPMILPSACSWRCTIPRLEAGAAREDPTLRRGMYVRAKTAEEAATILVSHEGLRPYERIDVQLWKRANGEVTTDAERADVICVVAGSRIRPAPRVV